eukprot:jgi/Mesvir1/11316/Mv08172-RA.1
MASLLSPLSVLPTFVGGRPLPSGKAKLRVQRQPGIRIPVPVKKGKRATVAAKSSEEGPSSSSSPDYYELLQVPRDADAAEIKANYRRFMKLYHPDRGWPADDGRSRTLVEAYRTLSDRRLREAYDKKLRHHRTAFGSMMWAGAAWCVAGGGGGCRSFYRVWVRGGGTACQYSELIHWVRQWGQTFLFSAELPLPLPIQCDDVEGGARMAFMGFKNKRLQAVGEMVITVEPDMRDTPAREEDGDAVDELQGMTCDVAPARWLVQVSRWHEQPGKLIPGEARVLKARAGVVVVHVWERRHEFDAILPLFYHCNVGQLGP